MRAVLDPNVLISALLTPAGTPAAVVAGWLAGRFELVVSERLLAELERALGYTKLRRRIDQAEATDIAVLLGDAATLRSDRPDPPARSTDPHDDYLVALAEDAMAILVSGDRHLLELADRFPVITPRAFLDALDAAKG